MIIKEVKFSYIESRYGMGPYVEFFSELEVPSLEYDDIVRVIEDNNPDYKNVKVMSYSKTIRRVTTSSSQQTPTGGIGISFVIASAPSRMLRK